MILISHRGNIDGKNEIDENKISYIENALSMGYDAEIDVWCVDNIIYLGHDKPEYSVEIDWININSEKLWIHCKNVASIQYFNSLDCKNDLNYFWHQSDTVVLTSKNYLWAYPSKISIKGSISVLPEIFNSNVDGCVGVCSDYIKKYKI